MAEPDDNPYLAPISLLVFGAILGAVGGYALTSDSNMSDSLAVLLLVAGSLAALAGVISAAIVLGNSSSSRGSDRT